MSTRCAKPSARDILRPFWCELQNRLQPQELVPWLYQTRIITDAEKETIQSGSTRSEQTTYLLDIMRTRSRDDAIKFAKLLSRTKGVQDLGKKVLSKAGEEFKQAQEPEETNDDGRQSYVATYKFPILLLTLLCIFGLLILLSIMQWKTCRDTEQNIPLQIHLEKQDHPQTLQPLEQQKRQIRREMKTNKNARRQQNTNKIRKTECFKECNKYTSLCNQAIA